MLNVLRFIGAVALIVMFGTAAQAQFVSMTGSYNERNGVVVNIPQNPPLQVCGAGGNVNAPPVNDAQCVGVRQTIYSPPVGPRVYVKPNSGVPTRPGVKNTVMGGLAQGDQFTVPTSFFGQTPTATIAGPVVNNAVIWISSAFTGRMPNSQRAVNPPASTRQMRQQGNGPIAGQPLRPTGAPATRNVAMVPKPGSNDTGTVTYKEGPRKFGGTMALLLDGQATLYIKTAAFDAFFPSAYTPVLGTQPVGNPTIQFNTRNAAGWEYAVTGGQPAGRVFGPTGTTIVPCATDMFPASPAGCNQVPNPIVAGTLDFGNFLPAATSTKVFFPFTTGTITQVINAVRGASGTFTSTLTAMGYDTTTMTPGVRNVGMVAGSYSARLAGTGNELGNQILGMNLSFTPEPASAVALFAGIGLLGAAAARRRR